jgi:hypothetical protein
LVSMSFMSAVFMLTVCYPPLFDVR